MLMVILDLFPAGSIQFKAVVERGLWFGRSSEFIDNGIFKNLTWLRGIGATVFFVGGVSPLTWFIVSRWKSLKVEAANIEEMDEANLLNNEKVENEIEYEETY